MFPFSGLLDLLCPPVCPVCDGIIENPAGKSEPICSACLQKIVTPNGQFCRRCGGRRFVLQASAEDCPRCRTSQFRFNRVIALGEYENDLRHLVLRMKTDKTGILAIAAANALADQRRAELESVGVDYIVPVPMHRFRRVDRGNNSPDTIAEELGRRLKIPVRRHLVRRIRPTDLQYTLSNRARAENVSGAFAVRPPNLLERLKSRMLEKSQGRSILEKSRGRSILEKSRGRSAAQSPDLPGKNILLVDDILTTGSTCNEIARILLTAGVRSVTVAVLARAEGNYFRPFD